MVPDLHSMCNDAAPACDHLEIGCVPVEKLTGWITLMLKHKEEIVYALRVNNQEFCNFVSCSLHISCFTKAKFLVASVAICNLQ